jgi:hypothetical protein
VEEATMSRHDVATHTEPDRDTDEDVDARDPSTPAIDEDVVASLNAALDDADHDQPYSVDG